MCHNTKILFKHKPILKVSDIKALETYTDPDTISENTITTINWLRSYEHILLQNKICKSPRRYTYYDMLKMQAFLENLDFLEALKYSGYAVNARRLLHKYLYSHYDFLSCDLLANHNGLHVKDILHSADIIEPNAENIYLNDRKDLDSPSKSIRTHLNTFLDIQLDNYRHIQCGCYSIKPTTFKTTSTNINNIFNKRFPLSVYQIPEFLLLFTFFDGRDFDHCNSQIDPHKLPPHKESNRFSEFSYQIVLKKFQEYISKSDISKPDNICPLTLSTIFRCDNIFLFYRLNLLLYYYDLYLSEDFLNTLIRRFNLSYLQIINLKETITNNIFKDENFIIAGLKSNHLDFMLPFDIFFQYTVFDPIPDLSPTPKQFEDILSDIKKKVVDIWNAGCFCRIRFSYLENGDFSIASNENTLIESIIKNPFYSYYFNGNNMFIKNSVENSNNNFLCFDTIKKFFNVPL